MADISKLLAFIEDHGSSLEKTRFQYILFGIQPQPDIIQSFSSTQNNE